MLLHAALVVLALAGTAHVTSGHEHHKQHSHFCQGGGYNLFCTEGRTLRIDKAWFGRIADDKESCIMNTTTAGDNTTSAQIHLAHDCGSSILDSKDSWCQGIENTGCNIQVTPALAPGHEDDPCPADAPKYLYLEYECLDGSSGSAARLDLVLFVLGLLALMLV